MIVAIVISMIIVRCIAGTFGLREFFQFAPVQDHLIFVLCAFERLLDSRLESEADEHHDVGFGEFRDFVGGEFVVVLAAAWTDQRRERAAFGQERLDESFERWDGDDDVERLRCSGGRS